MRDSAEFIGRETRWTKISNEILLNSTDCQQKKKSNVMEDLCKRIDRNSPECIFDEVEGIRLDFLEK